MLFKLSVCILLTTEMQPLLGWNVAAILHWQRYLEGEIKTASPIKLVQERGRGDFGWWINAI